MRGKFEGYNDLRKHQHEELRQEVRGIDDKVDGFVHDQSEYNVTIEKRFTETFEEIRKLARQNDKLQATVVLLQKQLKGVSKRSVDAASRSSSQQQELPRRMPAAEFYKDPSTWSTDVLASSVRPSLMAYLETASDKKTAPVKRAIKELHDFLVKQWESRNDVIKPLLLKGEPSGSAKEVIDSCNERLKKCLQIFLSVALEMPKLPTDQPREETFTVALKRMRDCTDVPDPDHEEHKAIWEAIRSTAQEETKVRAAELKLHESARPASAPAGKKAPAPAGKKGGGQGNGHGQGL